MNITRPNLFNFSVFLARFDSSASMPLTRSSKTQGAVRDRQPLSVHIARSYEFRKKELNEGMLTREEVATLLGRLQGVVRGELELELINATHMSLLLFRQLCGQVKDDSDIERFML